MNIIHKAIKKDGENKIIDIFYSESEEISLLSVYDMMNNNVDDKEIMEIMDITKEQYNNIKQFIDGKEHMFDQILENRSKYSNTQ